jgi:predicted nucleic acid-binding protein
LIAYVESSAAAKLLVSEPWSAALASHLDQLVADGHSLVSCSVLETELRRLAMREELPQVVVTAVLDRLDIYELDRAAYREAGLLPGRDLRSLDALHVAGALRIGADVMITYDARQAGAAEAAGLPVASPGEGA